MFILQSFNFSLQEREQALQTSPFLNGPPSSIWVGEVIMRMASGSGSSCFASAAKGVSSYPDGVEGAELREEKERMEELGKPDEGDGEGEVNL